MITSASRSHVRENALQSGGVSANRLVAKASGYLPPADSASSHAFLISASSSLLSLIFKEPTFSSILAIEVVPGIGKKSSPWAKIQAKVS
jgi:hypothetical protein